jgi:leucyl-tRNA synthetase
VETAALELPQVLRWLEGQPPRKVIVVPNRIVNIVA